VPFSRLSFTTEFVGDSFDVATDFLVLKMSLAALAIFRGIFWGSGRVCRLVLRGFWGPELGEGRWGVTKPKRDILVAV
jgi:hypothetical protein